MDKDLLDHPTRQGEGDRNGEAIPFHCTAPFPRRDRPGNEPKKTEENLSGLFCSRWNTLGNFVPIRSSEINDYRRERELENSF